MGASDWRERREHYLREHGRLLDLIREGYVEVPFMIITGGRRNQQGSSKLNQVRWKHEGGQMEKPRNPRYLARIRSLPCVICGSRRNVEAAHTGQHGMGRKSADKTAVPLCARHHRTGEDSYHSLGARAFQRHHSVDLAEIAAFLSQNR